MKAKTVKTTVGIDKEILYLAKLKALKENRTLRDIVNQSLAFSLKRVAPSKSRKKTKIGGYRLGGIKGNLSRTEIYKVTSK